MGIISNNEYSNIIKKAYDSLISTIYYEKDILTIDNICTGTCIENGTYEYYINRSRTKNDLHGIGAFVLMCTEMQKYLNMFEPKETRGNDYRLKNCAAV